MQVGLGQGSVPQFPLWELPVSPSLASGAAAPADAQQPGMAVPCWGWGARGGLQHGGLPQGPTVMLWGREVMLRGFCGAEGAPLRRQEVFLHAPNLKIGFELVVPGRLLCHLPLGV